MAASSLLLLIDDITAMLDDVAVLTKVAAGKTSGVMGDDLALNAEQVAGVRVHREIPVVWAVAKGSFVNKLILVPAALAISAFLPVAILPLLVIGGVFLCYEGFEKVAHKLLHQPAGERSPAEAARARPELSRDDALALEKSKITGAVRTDFVLSAEIIVITLGTMTTAPFVQQVLVLCFVAIGATVLVYGLVAGIVKLDDLGLQLHKKEGSVPRAIGTGILRAAPWLMKTLSVVGTAAMFAVGGGIIVHGAPPIEHIVALLEAPIAAQSALLGTIANAVFAAVVGLIAGGVAVGVVTLGQRLYRRGPAVQQG